MIKEEILNMSTLILSVLFFIVVCIESTAYAIYEMNVNKNKPAGIILILLSLVGLIFPIWSVSLGTLV